MQAPSPPVPNDPAELPDPDAPVPIEEPPAPSDVPVDAPPEPLYVQRATGVAADAA